MANTLILTQEEKEFIIKRREWKTRENKKKEGINVIEEEFEALNELKHQCIDYDDRLFDIIEEKLKDYKELDNDCDKFFKNANGMYNDYSRKVEILGIIRDILTRQGNRGDVYLIRHKGNSQPYYTIEIKPETDLLIFESEYVAIKHQLEFFGKENKQTVTNEIILTQEEKEFIIKRREWKTRENKKKEGINVIEEEFEALNELKHQCIDYDDRLFDIIEEKLKDYKELENGFYDLIRFANEIPSMFENRVRSSEVIKDILNRILKTDDVYLVRHSDDYTGYQLSHYTMVTKCGVSIMITQEEYERINDLLELDTEEEIL